MSDMSISSAKKNHTRELRNLTTNNEIEVEKLKVAHLKRKGELRLQQDSELRTIKDEHEIRLRRSAQKQAEVLKNLEDSLEQTKKVTDEQRSRILAQNEEKMAQQQVDFEVAYQNNTLQNQIAIQEMNEMAQEDVKRIESEYKATKHNALENNRMELRSQKDNHDGVIGLNKDLYAKKQEAQEVKFGRSLIQQKKNHNKLIADDEHKFQKDYRLKQINHQEQFKAQDELAKQKRSEQVQHFKEEFSDLMQTNEKVMQKLLGRKEKILADMQSYLWKNYQLGMKKSEDPFYDFGKLNPEIAQKEDRYEIRVPLKEHEASQISMVGEKRELKLMFERRHEFTKNEDDGSQNKMNKVESYVSSLPVEKIIDPKTISKRYEDGNVVFSVKYM